MTENNVQGPPLVRLEVPGGAAWVSLTEISAIVPNLDDDAVSSIISLRSGANLQASGNPDEILAVLSGIVNDHEGIPA